ncbi:MAG: DUF4331 family protein [Proteobacteria bacterium]|nr:DUF4331 family protein [Pseudomonadota bacterium]
MGGANDFFQGEFMKKRVFGGLAVLAASVTSLGLLTRMGEASDHDDGENANKERSLNLTDHFAFKSPGDPSKLSLIMYFNPRSLPGKQYFMAENARYEFHVTKQTSTNNDATGHDDFVFRFEAGAPNAVGVQAIKLTVLKDVAGTLTSMGTNDGLSTDLASSKAGTIHTNTGSGVGGVDVQWFVGQRADSFTFDVVRFFQVRNFLAGRFFGKTTNPAAPKGDASVGLAINCHGDTFGVADTANADADNVNLWNPPSCAPDFTKNLNVTAIVLNVPIAQLGGSVFDTWSTISVGK